MLATQIAMLFWLTLAQLSVSKAQAHYFLLLLLLFHQILGVRSFIYIYTICFVFHLHVYYFNNSYCQYKNSYTLNSTLVNIYKLRTETKNNYN